MEDLNKNPIFRKGVEFLQNDKLNEALQCFDEVLEKNPNMGEVWGTKGLVLYDMERFKEAGKSLDKALELNPNLSPMWVTKAEVLEELGKRNKAAATINKGLKSNPESAELWEQKAYYLAPKKKAIACSDKAISLNPNSPIAYAVKALIVSLKGSLGSGLRAGFEYIDKALEIDPTQPYVLLVQSILQQHRDQHEKIWAKMYTYSDCENCGMRVKSHNEINALSDSYCNRCGKQVNYDINRKFQRGEIDLTKFDRSIYQFCANCGTPNPKEAKKCKNCKLQVYSTF